MTINKLIGSGLLPIGILVYNTSEYSITKRTPFFINKKFKADVSLETRRCEELVLYALVQIKEIHKVQEEL